MDSISIVKSYYAAFNNRDWDGMLALLADDVRHEPNQGEARIGKALFREFMQKMDAAYAETLHDMVFMHDATGTRFACEFVVHGIYKVAEEGLPPAHGQSYRLPAGAFLEVRDGKIQRVTTYYNLPLWIDLVAG